MAGSADFNRRRAAEERAKAAAATTAGKRSGHLELARLFEERAQMTKELGQE